MLMMGWWCGVRTVARHVYGYREVLEGDSRPNVQDYYDGPEQV